MKVKIVKSVLVDGYFTYVVQGNQQFRIGYDHPAPEKECRWFKKMFLIALRAHDKEILTRPQARVPRRR